MNAISRQKDLRAPLKVARGMGSSKGGVHHWWLQRLTAVALVPLSIWFLFLLSGLINADYPAVSENIAQPLHTFLLIVFVVCLFWHGALGLDVVIGDYVHTRWLEVALQISLRFGAFLCTLASVMAILAIWLR